MRNQLVGLDDNFGLSGLSGENKVDETSPCVNLLATGLGEAPNIFGQTSEWWANFWTAYFGYGLSEETKQLDQGGGPTGLDADTIQRLHFLGVDWWYPKLKGESNPHALLFPSLVFGGPFTDDYGNRVFIYTKGALVPKETQEKFWGFKDLQKETHYVQVRNLLEDLQDTGWRLRWIEEFCSKTYNRRGDTTAKRLKDFTSPRENHLTRRILTAGYPTQKIDKPIFIHLHREVNTGIPPVVYVALAVAAAAAVVYFSGGTATSLVSGALSQLTAFASGDKKSLNARDLTNLVSAVIPGGSEIGKYVNSGLSLYEGAKSGNYGDVAKALGVKEIAGIPTDALQLVGKSSKGFNAVNSILGVANMAGSADSLTSMLANGQVGAELAQLGTMTKSPEMTNLMLATSMQGYSSLIPTNVGSNDAIASAINSCKGDIGNNANIHKALIDISLGLPPNAKALDNLTLEGLMNKATADAEARGNSLTGLSAAEEAKKKIRITLPAGLPADKKECFAQALAMNGFEVVLGGVDTGASATKAGYYPNRLEWQ